MHPSTSDNPAFQVNSGNGASGGDPLLERMTSILRLASSFSSPQRRERRYSDADRPKSTTANPLIRPNPVMMTSSGAANQLQAPNEQSSPVDSEVAVGDLTGAPTARNEERHSCSAAVCSVGKVFQTTELLELIFSFLEFKEVISLRTANRNCYSVVEQSKKLRLQFFVHGEWRRPHSQFQLLPLNLPGLSIQPGEGVDLGQWVEVSFNLETARLILPEPKPSKRVRSRSIFEGLRGGLGTRAEHDPWPANTATAETSSTLEYENLLIAQPPIIGMQAFVINPNAIAKISAGEDNSDVGPPPRAKISCESGITLGFLAETAQSLLNGNEAPSNVEEVEVMYKSIISFTESDSTPQKRRHGKSVIYL